jgi:shikimate dehydrogenase
MTHNITGDTKVVGVFGYPVEHSLSPAMHNAAFAALELSYIYIPFPVRPDSLGPAIRSLSHLGIVGVNLTIPHKEHVLPFLDAITDEAREIGAVNTVYSQDGKIYGDNTDGRGFYEPLQEQGITLRGRQVVVIGAGGAARAVVFRLAREGAQIVLTNRSWERAERLAQAVSAGYGINTIKTVAWEETQELGEAIARAELLVHTTRIGMYPEVDALPPLPLEAFHPDLLVYDLVYNPVETLLLKQAQARGCRTLNGVKMLVYQGAAAFERWTGIWPPTGVMEAAVLKGMRG